MSGQNQYDTVVQTHPSATPSVDECHFEAAVRFGRRKADQVGHLSITTRWLRFRGALDVSVSWREVVAVAHLDADFIVTLHASTTPMRFRCASRDQAARAAAIAERLAGTGTGAAESTFPASV